VGRDDFTQIKENFDIFRSDFEASNLGEMQ